jgi:hypothetical protein
MTQPTIEQRVIALEKTVAGLVAQSNSAKPKKDWRSTIGMFDDDPVMKEIQKEGRRIREAERREAQQEADA